MLQGWHCCVSNARSHTLPSWTTHRVPHITHDRTNSTNSTFPILISISHTNDPQYRTNTFTDVSHPWANSPTAFGCSYRLTNLTDHITNNNANLPYNRTHISLAIQ